MTETEIDKEIQEPRHCRDHTPRKWTPRKAYRLIKLLRTQKQKGKEIKEGE